MNTDKDLLKEVAKELWHSVKKLRPGLPKDARMQLVLKALVTIGDLANPIEAAMVVGVCLDLEEEDNDQKKETENSENKTLPTDEVAEGKRIVRRRSTANS